MPMKIFFYSKCMGVVMKALSFLYCKTIPVEEALLYECSDRLLVAKNICEANKLDQEIVILEIRNTLGETVVGSIYEKHDDDDIIYMPSWMANRLHSTNIEIKTVPLHTCTQLSLRPYNKGLFFIKDWHLDLRDTLRRYVSVTEGMIIPMNIKGLLHFSVERCAPHTTVCLHNVGNIDLNIMTSHEELADVPPPQISTVKPIVKPMVKPMANPKPKEHTTTHDPSKDYTNVPYLALLPPRLRKYDYGDLQIFGGASNTLGGTKPDTSHSPQVYAGYAALQRQKEAKIEHKIADGIVCVAYNYSDWHRAKKIESQGSPK